MSPFLKIFDLFRFKKVTSAAERRSHQIIFTLCWFQEKIIDLEGDLEELHDSEQRWAAKQKRAIEQVRAPGTGSAFPQSSF